MSKYVDGYLLAVPKNKLVAYRAMAQKASKIWKKHGALEYYEAAGNDLDPKWAGINFNTMVQAKPDETVIFSYIVFKSKQHRDEVNDKVMKDPELGPPSSEEEMPFDMKRMAYGGFEVIAES